MWAVAAWNHVTVSLENYGFGSWIIIFGSLLHTCQGKIIWWQTKNHFLFMTEQYIRHTWHAWASNRQHLWCSANIIYFLVIFFFTFIHHKFTGLSYYGSSIFKIIFESNINRFPRKSAALQSRPLAPRDWLRHFKIEVYSERLSGMGGGGGGSNEMQNYTTVPTPSL